MTWFNDWEVSSIHILMKQAHVSLIETLLENIVAKNN